MKTDRLVSIIMLLVDKKRVGARELADLFEVSPRTIYRDIDAINMAGIPVYSTPGVGGGFEIMQEYKIDKKVFSTADLSALLMGLSSLSGMMRGEELVHAFAKVKSFIPAGRAKDIELKVNQICVDLSPWTGNSTIQPYLEIMKEALQESRLVTFEYIAHHGNKTARTAEPYQLVLTMQTKIKIRVHKAVMDRVLDHCTYEDFTPDGDEHYIVSFPFIENEYHYDILLSFGDKCECLEPLHIRTEMQRRIQDMAAIYES